jgi:hypothetical protein
MKRVQTERLLVLNPQLLPLWLRTTRLSVVETMAWSLMLWHTLVLKLGRTVGMQQATNDFLRRYSLVAQAAVTETLHSQKKIQMPLMVLTEVPVHAAPSIAVVSEAPEAASLTASLPASSTV